ncbi:MAG: hypothetical protein JXA23_02810 [Bacteroidales bacterium]|nr:hypothetical protein [Bacteroidales bacterium]
MKTETEFDRFIREKAISGRNRIGIGILDPDEAIVQSLQKAHDFCDVIPFGVKVTDMEGVITESPEESLAAAIATGEVDAIVRGQAVATTMREELCKQFGYTMDSIRDIAVVKDNLNRIFIPCGIAHSQGWSVEQKIELIRLAVPFAQRLGLPVKIGVTSGARPEDMAPIPYIIENYNDANRLVALLQDEFPIKHYNIDIDKAVADGCSILVFANGMVGNHVLRSLVFLGQIRIYGGINAGIDPLVVESFRSSSGFYEYLEFANALANLP